MGQAPQQTASGDRPSAAEAVIIPVLAEELVVLTMERDTGGVRATKTVKESIQIIDEPLLREQVTVERRTMERMLDAPAQVRQEGDTLIIPVMEEVLVVQRRFLLKEEIHIRKVQTHDHAPQRFIVRSEVVKLEQLPAADKFHTGQQPPPAPRSDTKGDNR